MNRLSQILLLMVVGVLFSAGASGETMAERKQRIMRKYLHERQQMARSDEGLFTDEEENELITASEKFKESDISLSRDSSSGPAPRPMVRRAPAQTQARSSWLFDEESDADPYADPFGQNDASGEEENKTDWWTQWRSRQEEMAAPDPAGTSDYSTYGSAGQQTRQSRSYNSAYGSADQEGQAYGSTYGTPRTTYGENSSGNVGLYGTGRNGRSSSEGMLQLPAPSHQQEPESSGASGYSPYRSPYQDRQEQRRQPAQPARPEDSYTKPAPYQQWQDKNKQWDPTADDAYLDELMRSNRQ